ncbi:MAG: Holliday junction resolvase RuvX [Armatimonadota bacterium]|jgi:RNase H-fold protein (predicted Holliday junction resolvase)
MECAVLAVDPGTEKCGLAVASADAGATHLAIVSTVELGATAAALVKEHKVGVIVVGDRTGSRAVAETLSSACPDAEVVLVDEHMSTLRARERYSQDNPPRGLARLVPRGLRVPPEPYDDYVALVLAEKYFASRPPRRES